jgi:hypothetical protein
MTTTTLTDEQISIYKEYRSAKRELKRGRDFVAWMKIARGYDQARNEAMHHAGTNRPQGAAYREQFAKIDRREKLIERDDQGKEFPSPEDRTYCIKVLENYDAASADYRRPSIKAYRNGLSVSARARLNHPKRVWTSYWADTEPREEREAKRKAREMLEPKPHPFQEALAEAEAERHTARREAELFREQLERLRELLRKVLDRGEVPDDLSAEIDAALRAEGL